LKVPDTFSYLGQRGEAGKSALLQTRAQDLVADRKRPERWRMAGDCRFTTGPGNSPEIDLIFQVTKILDTTAS
jgi:hypothetical protein